MRFTLEALGHTLTLAIERDTEPEPDHPRGDIFATTERAEVLDFDRTPVGFTSAVSPDHRSALNEESS